MMRKQWIGVCLLLTGALLSPSLATAQAPWDVTGREDIQVPLPLGSDSGGGVYGAAEFLFMRQDRSMGNQDVAFRGFRDSDGSITGVSGTFVGTHNVALDTNSWGTTNWTPGYRVTLGYRLESGIALSVTYAYLFDTQYTAGAGPIPPSFVTGNSGENALLFSPVYNFNPQFSGPQNRFAVISAQTPAPGSTTTTPVSFTPIGSGGSPYGIWNGADTMTITYIQRFESWDITARLPVYSTDYARSYALAGGRFDWIWERFGWSTTDSNFLGQTGPQDIGNYSNIMSQRMYGPFAGIGNDIFLGSAFALNFDLTAAALYDIVKYKASYIRGDNSIEDKRAGHLFTIAPNVQANVALTWYPLKGVEIRTGYNLWSFFNSYYMQQPIGYNMGDISPQYSTKVFRYYQGMNVGISYSF